MNVNKTLASKEELYVTKKLLKYVIGYNDDDVMRPLCMKPPQMIGYVKNFDSNKAMAFRVDDTRLLKKYNRIWEIISNLLNIIFDTDPVYSDDQKYIKAKKKMYKDRPNTNFQSKKVPKEDPSYKCLSLIVLESIIRVSKKYYLQTLLEQRKYVVRNNKMENLINDDLYLNSPDNESENELYSDESND